MMPFVCPVTSHSLVEPLPQFTSKMRTTAFVSSQLPLSLALCADESSDSCDSRGASQELVLHQWFLGNIGVKQLASCSKWLFHFALLFTPALSRIHDEIGEQDDRRPGGRPVVPRAHSPAPRQLFDLWAPCP